MTKVLWFSRHLMTNNQFAALAAKLGDIEVTQINGTAPNVHVSFEGKAPEESDGVEPNHLMVGTLPPLKEIMADFDEVAVVLPIGMLQQALPFAKSGRLLQALNLRVIGDDGKATFVFDKWQAVKEIKIVTEDL